MQTMPETSLDSSDYSGLSAVQLLAVITGFQQQLASLSRDDFYLD
jgi:hypothetical protein